MRSALYPRSKTFSLHLRCSNCLRDSFRDIAVPQVDGAPTCVDEFIESILLQRLAFDCSRCESVIGRLIGVTVQRERQPEPEPEPMPAMIEERRLRCA